MSRLLNYFLLIALLFIYCDKKPTGPEAMDIVNFYGKTYRTVKIGDQWWLAENLKVTKYRDGSSILNVTDQEKWVYISTGAYCAYNNDESNADTYGYLYNWYAAVDPFNIAPRPAGMCRQM